MQQGSTPPRHQPLEQGSDVGSWLRMNDELEALLEEAAARAPGIRPACDVFLVSWGRAGDMQRHILHRQLHHAAQQGPQRLEDYLIAAAGVGAAR